MELTREADYAVLCVIEVARSGRLSAAEIARRNDVSPTFLGKIVSSLARAGMVITRRGVHGGIELTREPHEVTLLDVIEAVQGPLCINECLYEPSRCSRDSLCPAYPAWREAQRRLRSALDVTLAELLQEEQTQERDASGNGSAAGKCGCGDKGQPVLVSPRSLLVDEGASGR